MISILRLCCDSLAYLTACHITADLYNRPGELVSRDQRRVL